MALVLDTSMVAPADRAEAVRAAMRLARVPALLTHESEERIHARLSFWQLGEGAALMHRAGSGLVLRRTPGMVRRIAEDRLGFVLLSPGRWSFAQGAAERREQYADWGIMMVDQALPYEFGRYGDGATVSFNVDRAVLGLPGDLIRAAAPRLRASPVRRLVMEHLLGLTEALDQPAPVRSLLGSATVDLVRALVATTADPRVEQPGEALLTQTKLYVRRHYGDPALDAARIARVHAVSVRRLYAVWAGDAETLAGHIIRVRLEEARSLLAVRTQPVAAVGRACGFVDMAHFARRFRQAFGMSPREWRAVGGLGTLPGTTDRTGIDQP